MKWKKTSTLLKWDLVKIESSSSGTAKFTNWKMDRAKAKILMREKVTKNMKVLKTLLQSYNGPDKVRQLVIFEHCNGLIIDPDRYLKYDTLVKLTCYADKAMQKCRNEQNCEL